MNSTTSPVTFALDGDPYFTPEEVAARYGYTKQTFANMRSTGRGPRFVKIGHIVRYRLSDLAAWEKTFRRCGKAGRKVAA